MIRLGVLSYFIELHDIMISNLTDLFIKEQIPSNWMLKAYNNFLFYRFVSHCKVNFSA